MAMRWKWLVVLCALFAAGCGSVTTKYPIGSTTGLVPDTALVGTWRGQIDDSKPQSPPFFLHFIKTHGPMLAVWVAPRVNDKGEGGVILFQITTGRTGDNRFINSKELKMGAPHGVEGKGTFPSLYQFDGNDLLLYKLDKQKTAEAIRSGKIAGIITQHGSPNSLSNYEDVQITAEPVALDAFMATSEGKSLFDSMMVLKKVE
jgi:hypothetical protein